MKVKLCYLDETMHLSRMIVKINCLAFLHAITMNTEHAKFDVRSYQGGAGIEKSNDKWSKEHKVQWTKC